MGPNFSPSAPPAETRYTPAPLPDHTTAVASPGGASQRFVDGADVSGRWWTLFGSPQLDALMAQGLKANPDLAAAQAALRAARETYAAQKAALLPTLGAGYNLTSQKATAALAPPLSSNFDTFTLQTAELTVGYSPDVFGAIRRQTESVAAQAEAQRDQTEAVYLTFTSNLAAAAIQEAGLTAQIDATQAVIGADRRALAVLRDERAAGEAGDADVAAQESVLAQAEATLPPLEKQRLVARDMIADLTGRYPGEGGVPRVDLASLTLPGELPVTLPSRLVVQRPDVRAAEANLHSASALVGVAIANRLPNIALSANAGGEAGKVSQLFTTDNTFWLVAGEVTQPIFDGGALLHRQRGARAAYEQARAQYRSTVLSAFQNVADALQAIDTDARTLAAAAASEQGALRSLDIARRQNRAGQVGATPVLNAEQAWSQAVATRVQAQTARYADTAALYVALGGGWWNRSETAAAGGPSRPAS